VTEQLATRTQRPTAVPPPVLVGSAVTRRGRSALTACAVLLGAAAFWEIGARLLGSLFVPPLSRVLAHIAGQWFSGPASRLWLGDPLLEAVGPSVARVVPAFAVGVAAGVLLGVAIGLVRPIREVVYPVVHFLRAIPSAAKIPLFIVLLGIGDEMKMSVIAVAVSFPVLINTVDGVRGVEPTLLDVCRIHHVPRWRRVLSVVLPAATPQVFAGIRVASAVAFIVMIVVEMLAATNGVGYLILYAQRQFRFLDMWAGLLLLAVLGYLLNLGLSTIEHRLLGWHHGARRRAA
jgi:ABC-type nitrate/sulfonate/bicarbonate transport system permease component